ncbi:hypothetical protein RHSIM_Rhsim06G0011100 [Rhododendron simsii]|uniref:Uncharacterized protein n=1 Tax=Rhododendron simsii TaxID=118357 RepID=A0A834GT58_RHOSS|nr:hypothetical protein RHSIM_Rhsim06G0011100 [Rhododendron simsii]
MGGGTVKGPVSSQPRRGMEKFKVYGVVLKRLRDSDNKEASQPGFEDELCNHFNRLPPSYATEVNVLQPEDVIMHMKLLRRAEDATSRPAFEVRIVQFKTNVDAQTSGGSTKLHSPPTLAVGLSPSLEVAHELN